MAKSPGGAESGTSPEGKFGNPLVQNEVQKAKGLITRTANDRINTYRHVVKLVPAVEQARVELEAEFMAKGYDKPVGNNAIAKWLNRKPSPRKPSPYPAPEGGEWSRAQVRDVLMRAPEKIIELAVLECRTRMTALALSADFTKPVEAVNDLEREYLGYIAEALEIWHRLHGTIPLPSHDELLTEARREAVRVAERQRRAKPVSMAARAGLWKGFPPIAKKVFDAKIRSS